MLCRLSSLLCSFLVTPSGQSVKVQPIPSESLASRLGVTPESLRKERESQPATLFFAWCKRKDTSGIGWEFNEKTNLYHPVT